MAAPAPLPPEWKVRELVTDPKLTDEQVNSLGDQFLDAGRPAVALLFYERTKDRERLKRVLSLAVDTGDAFLLRAVERLAPGSASESDWRAAAERALADKKLLFAKQAFEKAGDTEKADAAHQEWLKIFSAPEPSTGQTPGTPS